MRRRLAGLGALALLAIAFGWWWGAAEELRPESGESPTERTAAIDLDAHSSRSGAAARSPAHAAAPPATVDGASGPRTVPALVPKTGSLEVAVRRRGVPLAGATPAVRESNSDSSSRRAATTGSDGVARFDGLRVGPCDVTMGRLGESVSVDIESATLARVEFTFDDAIDVVIQVLGTSGESIAGATVRTWPISESFLTVALESSAVLGVSDALGQVRAAIPPGEGLMRTWFAAEHAVLGSSRARRFPNPDSETAVPTAPLVLQLVGDRAALALRVTDSSGNPIEDAEVSLRATHLDVLGTDPDGTLFEFTRRITRTAADGTARLFGVPLGPWALTVTARGRIQVSQGVELLAAREHHESIVLPAAASLSGRVLDVQGRGIADAAVAVNSGSSGAWCYSDSTGAYSIAGLAAGAITVSVSHDDHVTLEAAVVLESGKAATSDFALERRLAIGLRVTDDAGIPLENWRAFAVDLQDPAAARSPEVLSDSAGRLSLSVSASRPHRVWLFAPTDVLPVDCAELVQVEPSEAERVVIVGPKARASAFVEGQILEADGSPALAGRQLVVVSGAFRAPVPAALPQSVLDPAGGRFRVGPLPGGRHVIEFTSATAVDFWTEPFEVVGGQTLQLGRVLVPAAGFLVIDAEFEPNVRADDVFVNIEGSVGVDHARFAVAAPTLRHPLLPGRYTVALFGSGLAAQSRTVVVHEGVDTPLSCRFRAGVRVRLNVARPDGETAGTLRLVGPAGDAIETKRMSGDATDTLLASLAPGDYEVIADCARGTRYAAKFQVEDLRPWPMPLELRLRPVR